jgi:hypothetical protein
MMLKPGDYPMGSPESRAAARAQHTLRKDARKRIEIVSNVAWLWDGDGAKLADSNEEVPHVGPWQDWGETLMRIVYLPMRWQNSPITNSPVCPSCGTPFRREESKYPG